MTERASGFVEQALFAAPPGCLLRSTADGEHVIVVDHLGIGEAGLVERDGVYVSELYSPDPPKRVLWDGEPGPELDAVVPLPLDGALLRFSLDRQHVTYLAATRGRTRARVGVDGSLGPEFEGISAEVPPTLSPTGGRIAYVAPVEGVLRMVVDHVPQLEFVPSPMPPLFDRGGDRIAFVAVSPSGGPPERVVLDGVAEREYDGIIAWRLGDGTESPLTLSSLAFGPDGRLGYVALQGSGMVAVVDGVESPRFDAIEPQLAFSSGGGRVAYPARRGHQMTCVVDGVAQEPYDGVGRPAFSPDGARLAYAAERGKRFALVVDGSPEGDYSEPPRAYGFSPDGEHYAYLTKTKRALRGDRWCCVVDGVAGPEFDGIESLPVFSPRGDRLAYVARRGRESFVVVDGTAGPSFDWTQSPSFSAAGRLAYVMGDSEESGGAVILEDRAGPSFEELVTAPAAPEAPWPELVQEKWFVFSPDGLHIAYTGAKRGLGARPVVDDAVGPAYEVVTFPAVDDERATFYGWRDGYVHRVTYEF